jgi:hypothetical protein
MYDTFASSIGNERYLRIHPVNVLIANNTFYSPILATVGFHFYSTPIGEADNAYPTGSVAVKNNIIYQPADKFISTYEDTGKVIGQQAIENNCVYNAATGDNKIAWRGLNYTINAAPGCANNIEVNPRLDSVFRPQATECKRAGSYFGGKDYYGKHFYNPPNIGAVEDHATPAWETVIKKT